MKRITNILDKAVCVAVHILLAGIAFSGLKPVLLPAHPNLSSALLSGMDTAYSRPGAEFRMFKPYLPNTGRISLILDEPNRSSAHFKETSFDAQNFLAPLLINLETVEPLAIVSCSGAGIAEKRLAETGYVWSYPLAPGKGIARKVT